VAYYRRWVTPAKRNYSTYEECLAVLFRCEKCRAAAIWSTKNSSCITTVSLCWLLKIANEIGRLVRWVLSLAPFKFKLDIHEETTMSWRTPCPRCSQGSVLRFLRSHAHRYCNLYHWFILSLMINSCVTFFNELRQKILTRQAAAYKFRVNKNFV